MACYLSPCVEVCLIELSSNKENALNRDRIAGSWKQFKGKIKETWGKLTRDHLTMIEGKKDQLIGRLQERYGLNKEQAERQAEDFHSHCP